MCENVTKNPRVELDQKSIKCPDCGSHYFTVKHIPSAKTYYLLCLDCANNNQIALKFITTELIDVSEKSRGGE